MSGHEMEKTTVTQFLLALVGALIPVLIVAFLIFKLVMGIWPPTLTWRSQGGSGGNCSAPETGGRGRHR